MKFAILKNNLKAGLDAVGHVVGGEAVQNLPVLRNILIETVDNRVKLCATNLEIAVTSFVPAKVSEKGGITVPFSILNSVVGALQSDRIEVEEEDGNIIVSTENYHAKIQGIKKDEFPIIPKLESTKLSLEISSALLADALLSVSVACQMADSKPELSGVLFHSQDKILKFAATDTFRLTEKIMYDTQFSAKDTERVREVIPLRAVQEATRIFSGEKDEKVKIEFNDNQILFENENAQLISRLLSGEFPDYQSLGIIPSSFATEVVVKKEDLVSALKLCGLFTDKFNEIKLRVKSGEKNIEIYSASQGLGENKYLISAKTKGEAMEVVFNWRFFLDGIKNLSSDDVFIGLQGANKPALIKSPADISYFYILMPIQGA